MGVSSMRGINVDYSSKKPINVVGSNKLLLMDVFHRLIPFEIRGAFRLCISITEFQFLTSPHEIGLQTVQYSLDTLLSGTHSRRELILCELT